nr:hypothetical protein Q903MT_gene2172 [Picea sitchensis]
MINGRKDCEGTAGWLSSQGLLPLLATPIMDHDWLGWMTWQLARWLIRQ